MRCNKCNFMFDMFAPRIARASYATRRQRREASSRQPRRPASDKLYFIRFAMLNKRFLPPFGVCKKKEKTKRVEYPRRRGHKIRFGAELGAVVFHIYRCGVWMVCINAARTSRVSQSRRADCASPLLHIYIYDQSVAACRQILLLQYLNIAPSAILSSQTSTASKCNHFNGAFPPQVKCQMVRE